MVLAIPGGTFTMGDEFNTVDPNHPSDETPLHTVTLSSFDIGKFDITDEQYCDYLNSALSQGLIQVDNGLVYGAGSTYGVGSDLYSETRQGEMALYGSAIPPLTTPYSGISWNGSQFSVLAGDQNMPMVGIYWDGTVAYCNWLSTTEGFQACYTYNTIHLDLHLDLQLQRHRLSPAHRGRMGIRRRRRQHQSLLHVSWGDNPNTNGTYANTLGSGSPYAQSSDAQPDGPDLSLDHARRDSTTATLQQQSQLATGRRSQTSYQTSNAENGYGLYDMAGDVWQWTNDWYAASYYTTCYDEGTVINPTGPTPATPSARRPPSTTRSAAAAGPRTLSDATIANRDPAFYREPLHTRPTPRSASASS